MRNIAITDIHGCAKTFQKLVEQEVQLKTEDKLYLLGDYIDRGPDSKGVIDYIFELQERGFEVNCLRGNHEQMMMDGVDDKAFDQMWFTNGGKQTLQSFGVKTYLQFEDRYKDFFEDLHYFFEVDDYILVHAGLNLKKFRPLEIHNAMLWMRPWNFVKTEWLGDRIVLHGHTPIGRPEIEDELADMHSLGRLDIDGGCVYKSRLSINMGGHLCAFDLSNTVLYFCENIDI